MGVPGLLRRVSLRIATFNNMCYYFRARGKLHAAQQLAERALTLEARHNELEPPPIELRLTMRKVPSSISLSKAPACEQAKDPQLGREGPRSKRTHFAQRRLHCNPMPTFQALPRLQEVSGHIGGPAAQQQAHGVQPLSRLDQDRGQESAQVVDMSPENRAAITMQKAWRGHAVRRGVTESASNMEGDAATCVQQPRLQTAKANDQESDASSSSDGYFRRERDIRARASGRR